MTDWEEYGTVLSEVLHTAPPDTDLFLRGPGGRYLALYKRPDALSAFLSPARGPLQLPPDESPGRLGWLPSPQGFALPPLDLDSSASGLVDLAVRTLREVLRVGSPGEVSPVAYRVDGPPPDVTPLRFALAPAAALDTSGWHRPHGSAFWTDARTGGRILFQPGAAPPDVPHWLDDLPAARRALTVRHARVGCLISADPVTIGDMTGLACLAKVTHAARPRVSYTFTVWLLRATRAVYLHHVIDAPDPPDPRSGAPAPHPYAPAVRTALPYLPSDEQSFDPSHPDHPLTHSRTWLHALPYRLKLSPSFTAAPVYSP
ncbi:hypothetical protein EDD29_0549 [Actinocorallia herbida]|uniref:TY-Chap N-terminal domain-containing protein n=1 Tax=Actinocorallia herbida TaxID=58109 RepID=A0A3N1CP18_9ACTN|nr:hypothetical protein [Actinocorallia herbida]ROO83060.1 hypothetical protein EDD29_0549 [Actinocorallia herbida]